LRRCLYLCHFYGRSLGQKKNFSNDASSKITRKAATGLTSKKIVAAQPSTAKGGRGNKDVYMKRNTREKLVEMPSSSGGPPRKPIRKELTSFRAALPRSEFQVGRNRSSTLRRGWRGTRTCAIPDTLRISVFCMKQSNRGSLGALRQGKLATNPLGWSSAKDFRASQRRPNCRPPATYAGARLATQLADKKD